MNTVMVSEDNVTKKSGVLVPDVSQEWHLFLDAQSRKLEMFHSDVVWRDFVPNWTINKYSLSDGIPHHSAVHGVRCISCIVSVIAH